MRFTRIVPADLDELRQAVLGDLEALAPGLRALAGALPLGGGASADLLACDGRGRLALVMFSLEADAADVARALSAWDRAIAGMGMLRALLAGAGADLSALPRLILVCSRALEGARRLGGYVARPDVEILEASVLAADGRRGLMVERAAAAPPAAEALAGADPALGAVMPGHARALMRRVIEELRDAPAGSERIEASGLSGSIELRRGGRPIAWMLETPEGVEVRRLDGAPARKITGDEDCRAAVRFLLEGAGPPAASEPEGSTAGSAARPSAALTREEILEFERLGAAPSPEWGGAAPRPGYVEN